MFLRMFEEYFDRVTNGIHRREYQYIGKNIADADAMFFSQYNCGILDRPDFYEQYIEMLRTAMRMDGAPNGLVDEVCKRLRDFFRMNFNVR